MIVTVWGWSGPQSTLSFTAVKHMLKAWFLAHGTTRGWRNLRVGLSRRQLGKRVPSDKTSGHRYPSIVLLSSLFCLPAAVAPLHSQLLCPVWHRTRGSGAIYTRMETWEAMGWDRNLLLLSALTRTSCSGMENWQVWQYLLQKCKANLKSRNQSVAQSVLL